MRLSRFPLLLSILAGLLLGVSGAGVRAGLWPFPTGFTLLRWAACGGLAAAGLALVMLLMPRVRAGRTLGLLTALLVGVGVAYVPWNQMQIAKSVPPIHDISTDLDRPPEFVAIVPLRAGAPNPPAYPGPDVAAAQRQGYPDLGPLTVKASPGQAFLHALEAARAMGWQIVASEPATGRIEATATTRWFGFKDDVVVRVQEAPGGSRIDVRSKSRVGRSDVGANAARIRAYLARIRQGA